MIPFLLGDILSMLQEGRVSDLIEFMDSLHITNEMVKEHLMGLTLDKNVQAYFDKIETRQKTAFTKEYNKTHKEI